MEIFKVIYYFNIEHIFRILFSINLCFKYVILFWNVISLLDNIDYKLYYMFDLWIKKKISKSWCEETNIQSNPSLEIAKTYIANPFCKHLHCNSRLQNIALWSPCSLMTCSAKSATSYRFYFLLMICFMNIAILYHLNCQHDCARGQA